MLRITTSHSAEAAKNYFDVALKTSDYYTKDVGTWGGKGAEILELKGDVQRKDFVALANNKWPGGRRSAKSPTGGLGTISRSAHPNQSRYIWRSMRTRLSSK